MSTHPKDTKHPQFSHLPLSTSGPESCALTVAPLPFPLPLLPQLTSNQGTALLRSPYHNKGSAFPFNERRDFELLGLLPPNVQTLDEQVRRAYQQFCGRQDALAKNTFMTSLKHVGFLFWVGL